MAEHIESVRDSDIPKVTKADFYSACRSGMALFCQGRYPISWGIESFTGSAFSHIATLFYTAELDRWTVLEATKKHGVHVGHLSYYTDAYDGDLVLAATPSLTREDYPALLKAQFDLVDDAYDTGQEISMAAHRLLAAIPIRVGKNAYFCSGLYQQGRRATTVPLSYSGPGMASPEEVWTDRSIVPVCALIRR